MANVAEAKPCSNPGCDQPGTKNCSACSSSFYCSVICQTTNWPSHREICDGHLRKVGKAYLAKAMELSRQNNWLQMLRYGELAATKLMKLKDRRLETVQLISDALSSKLDAYGFMGRYKEAKDCAEECYTLWAMNHLRNPGSIRAALMLIQSCLSNREFEDAHNYARHAMFMINDMTDNFIPSDQRSEFLADASFELARTIFCWARVGGIPPEGKQKAGEEAIELARQALKIHNQLHGTHNNRVANAMNTLADVLDYFNDVDDDEILRLREQAISLIGRLEGRSSYNVAMGVRSFASDYHTSAERAYAANDEDRCIINLEQALPHYREATRIFRVLNDMESADKILPDITMVEENLQKLRRVRAAAAAAAETRG